MKQTRWLVGAVAMFLILVSVSPVAYSVPPNEDQATSMRLALQHPISAIDAFTAIARSGLTAVGAAHRQEIAGEFFTRQGESPDSAATAYDLSVFNDYGTYPAVVELIVLLPAGDAEGSLEELARIAIGYPTYTAPPPDPLVAESRGQESQQRAAEASRRAPSDTEADDYYTPTWAPSYADVQAVEEGTGVAFYQYFSWDSTAVYDPNNMPEDWGIEFDLGLYNYSIPNAHPFCEAGTEDNFWAARGTSQGEIRSWSAYNLGFSTSDLGVYFDGNDFTNDCSRLSLGMGVGYPHNIDALDGLYALEFIVKTDRGVQENSPIELAFQAITNDCENRGLPVPPNSNCMGITYRDWPGPGLNYGFALNDTTGYVTPVCWTFTSGPVGVYLYGCP